MSDQSFEQYKYENKLPTKFKFYRLLWDLVYLLFFRTTPRWTCHRWRVFLLRRQVVPYVSEHPDAHAEMVCRDRAE